MKLRTICTYVLSLVMLAGVCAQTSFAGVDNTRDEIKDGLARVEMKANKSNATYQNILAAHKSLKVIGGKVSRQGIRRNRSSL